MGGTPSGVPPKMLLAVAAQEWLDGRVWQAWGLIQQLYLDYDLLSGEQPDAGERAKIAEPSCQSACSGQGSATPLNQLARTPRNP